MNEFGKDRIRAKLKGGDTLVRVLLRHPMHTGRGKNDAGELIPAEFIQSIDCWRNEQKVLTIDCGTATAANPYLSFELLAGNKGDTIKVAWLDNLGRHGTAETLVK